jgi:uncharacterized protein with HEPN domain
MRIESKKYLYDITRAAKLALGFIADKSFADYNADIMLRSAVERQLEIVGEALAQLARTDSATASQIAEYQRIIAFRNILIHGYAEIDHRIVWNVLGTQTASRPPPSEQFTRHRRPKRRYSSRTCKKAKPQFDRPKAPKAGKRRTLLLSRVRS